MQTDRLTQLLDFLRASPGDSFLRYAIAIEYAGKGEEQEAEKYFRELMETDPAYVPTYYHLGKLLERTARQEEAIPVYLTGKEKAKAARDMHTLAELQGALEALGYEEEEDW